MQITLSQFTVPRYNGGGATATLRIYADRSFLTSDGNRIYKSRPGGPVWYQSVACTVSGTVVTVPSFTIDSNTDSDTPAATYSALLFDANGIQKDYAFKHWSVPTSLGASITFAQLVAINAESVPNVPGITYTQDQVNALIANFVEGSTLATEEIYGAIKLSEPAGDPTAPIVVVDNDPRVTAEVNSDKFDTLALAVADIGATSKTLVISTAETVAANLTIPATTAIRFTRAGSISVNTGVTLTINSIIEAPPIALFSGLGTVTLASSKNLIVFPEWFGATGDYVAPTVGDTDGSGTNDRTAINAAITAAPVGATIQFSAKNYRFSGGSLTITKKLKLKGAGQGFWASGTLALTEQGTALYFDTNQHGIIIYATDGSLVEIESLSVVPQSHLKVTVGTYHGIWMKSAAIVRDVTVVKFAGSGVHIGSFLVHTNFWRLEHVTACGNNVHGVHIPLAPGDGGGTSDNNDGVGSGVDARDNTLDGIFDESQHGNTFIQHHASYNGRYGIHTNSDGTQDTVFIGGYEETNTTGSFYFEGTQSGTVLVGGTHSPDGAGNGVFLRKILSSLQWSLRIQDGSPDFYSDLRANGLAVVTSFGGQVGVKTVSGVATLYEFITLGGLWQWKDAAANIFMQVDVRSAGDKIVNFLYGLKTAAALLFTTDNAHDIGAAGATRPRTIYAGTSIVTADDAYDATNWNGSNAVPTKNAVRDKIELLAPKASPTFTGTVGADVVAATGAVSGASVAATGLIKSSSASAGVGYATGAGGTVAQGTSKATGVTLDKMCGTITMHNASLAGATIVSFVLTNGGLVDGDVMILNHLSGGTIGSYTLNARCDDGQAIIDIRNNTAGALGEAIVISFAVIKAVSS